MSYKLPSICMKVIAVTCFLLFLQPVTAQYNWGDLDAQLEAKQKILGTDFVIMVWKGDSLVYKKERGTFNAKTQAPIASCSKWLTAALVMQFVDEGKISLDDKVSTYIPELNKYFKGYITLRDCLSHMTGIEDEGGFLKKAFQRKKFSTLEEEVNSFAAREIRAKTGTDFWYGNIGLNMAGRVLEVVSKRKFDVLIRTKLLIPLGMRKTTFTNLEGGAVNPSGGAQSTAEDYMKFLVMLLNKGKYNGVQLLSENAVNEMMQIRTSPSMIKYAPPAARGFNYASGAWVVEEKDGEATALASPGLFGTWPLVDYCRGYAYLVFVKNLLGEQRAEAHLQLKEVIDEQIKNDCK
ncbi:MAG: beta-lactamase family protein [Sphingobacteriales bacterium]|nr:beta-lactamase family protein [Sphingobacteriales bacterium]